MTGGAGGSWPCTPHLDRRAQIGWLGGAGPAQPLQGSQPPTSRKACLILPFPQPAHVAGLENPVHSDAAAHLVPPATMLLGSAIVPLASLDLAVSRVSAPLNIYAVEWDSSGIPEG